MKTDMGNITVAIDTIKATITLFTEKLIGRGFSWFTTDLKSTKDFGIPCFF